MYGKLLSVWSASMTPQTRARAQQGQLVMHMHIWVHSLRALSQIAMFGLAKYSSFGEWRLRKEKRGTTYHNREQKTRPITCIVSLQVS